MVWKPSVFNGLAVKCTKSTKSTKYTKSMLNQVKELFIVINNAFKILQNPLNNMLNIVFTTTTF